MLFEFVLLICFFYLLHKYFENPKGMPPGEWGFPVIGCLPPRNVPIRSHFENLRNKYGDIFTLKLGTRSLVIVSDFALAKTAFNKQELTGRPDYFTIRSFMLFENSGIIGSERMVWQDHRRFALTHLKDLGLGKSIIEDAIMTEVSAIIDELDKNADKPFELSYIINVAILNIIWNLVASKRYGIQDKEIIHFIGLLNKSVEIAQGPAQFFDMYPKMLNIVPNFIKNKVFEVDKLLDAMNSFYDFIRNVVKEHEKNLDPDDPKDFIDSYILEVRKQKDSPNTTFNENYINLYVSIANLFIAGSETTSNSLRYTILYLIQHPDVQEKCQKEIDEFVPRDTRPNLEHRNKLVYLEATIMEAQRRMSLVPLSLPHTATNDTTLGGYLIPEGTVVMAFTEFCHNDPRYWDNPEEFRPERFIDENGKLKTKMDGYMPFSVGRRVCLGESLAKMELFLFVAALVQRYTFSNPPNVKLENTVDKNLTLVNTIQPFNVVFKKRI